jgi:septal ring factor EnvC (AmiA/AmiB activator)
MPIKQLEHELNLKINELNESLRIQDLLVETLENSNKRLGEMESALKSIAEKIQLSSQYINALEQENQGLKTSCGFWVQRAIKLEFEVLSARDAANKS